MTSFMRISAPERVNPDPFSVFQREEEYWDPINALILVINDQWRGGGVDV